MIGRLLIVLLLFTSYGSVFAEMLPPEKWSYIQTGRPSLWTWKELESKTWTRATKLSFSGRQGNMVYLKTTLPSIEIADPSIYISLVSQSFEVYCNGNMIYQFGNPNRGREGFSGWPAHIIPIPKSCDAKSTIIFKIYSDLMLLGFSGPSDPEYANRADIEAKIVKRDIDRFSLGFLYIMTGAFSCFMYARRRKQISYLTFGAFALCAGIYSVTNRTLEIQHLIWHAPMALYYIEYTTLFLLPATIALFFREIAVEGRVYAAIALVHVLYFSGAMILDLTLVPLYHALLPFFNVALISAIIGLIFMVREIKRGNKEARTLSFGLTLFVLTAIYDLLGNLGYIPWPRQLVSWGFFAFMLSMIYVLEVRFSADQDRLTLYAAELEGAKANLEEKVELRTDELRKSLEKVRELKTAQDGDYFLTSLLLRPLARNAADSGIIEVDTLTKQKKQFEFKNRKYEIGGDISISDTIELSGKRYIVFANADAMGKSLQGAGGAIVLGSVFNSLIIRSRFQGDYAKRTPVEWITQAFLELQHVFESFDCSMLVSCVLGLVEEETGLLTYVSAEHPSVVLFRDAKASFLDTETAHLKLGTPHTITDVHIRSFQMKKGDHIIAGSDGRDDLHLGGANIRIMNENELLFLEIVERAKGDLKEIAAQLEKEGSLTDDLTLLRLAYNAKN